MEIDSLEIQLLARRKRMSRQNPYEQTILGEAPRGEKYEQFYAMMKKYSFRLFLRDLLEQPEKVHVEQLTKYCSLRVAQNYLDSLQRLEIVDADREGYCHVRNPFVPNFGRTLEWYVAEVLQREFGATSRFCITFHNGSTGGDYDVLAAWLGRLVYVEVKSAPPKGIDIHQVKTFLGRIWDLLPDIAIFFNDTHLRMKDKIVALFEEEIARRYGREGLIKYRVQRLEDELFHVNHCLYIVNSKREIAHNFHVCLSDYLANELNQKGMP